MNFVSYLPQDRAVGAAVSQQLNTIMYVLNCPKIKVTVFLTWISIWSSFSSKARFLIISFLSSSLCRNSSTWSLVCTCWRRRSSWDSRHLPVRDRDTTGLTAAFSSLLWSSRNGLLAKHTIVHLILQFIYYFKVYFDVTYSIVVKNEFCFLSQCNCALFYASSYEYLQFV
jgi:hypothetical protein